MAAANIYHKACVTGGAGFIGSRLARRLLQEGLEVAILDNLSVGLETNVPSGARLIVGDVLDAAACAEAIKGCDILFHLAARVAIRSSFEFVVEDTMTNVSGTASAMRAAWKSGTVRKVITASSMGIYADSSERAPIGEEYRAEPVAPYGVSKYAAECLTHNIAANTGMESVALRLFNTYGTGQRLSPYVGVITIFVNKLRQGQSPTIFGDGMQTRDFVHVDDVVSGFMQAKDSAVSGQTFNIGTGHGVTVRSVYDAVSKAMNVSLSPEFAAALPGELRYSVASIEKARRLLGYAPRHQFETSITPVVQEMLAV